MTSLESRAVAELRSRQTKSASQTQEYGLCLVPTNLDADQSSPEHVINHLVPRGVVTLLGAHGGAGKSVLALTLAAMVATGRTWAELGIDKGKALFVSLEDPAALVNFRLRRIADAYDLDRAVVTENVLILDGSDADAALVGEIRENGVSRLGFNVAAETMRQAATGCSLIVIDNASDAYDANENERRLVRGFVRLLTKIARENNAGMILLAHVDKFAARNGAQGNTYSGSTAWHNSARSRLAMLAGPEGVELRQEKANLGRPLDEPIHLYWTDQGILMPMVGSTEGARRQDDTDAVLNALRAAWAAGVDVGTARVGSATTQHVLATFSELPTRLHGPNCRTAFWSAIDKLLSAGKVVTSEIVTNHRKKKAVFAAPNCAESFAAHSAQSGAPSARRRALGGMGDSAQVHLAQVHLAQNDTEEAEL